MDIIPLRKEFFDDFVGSAGEDARILAARRLEEADLKLASMLPASRFRAVNKRPRTVLTEAGPVTFRRRCYEDLRFGGYITPLDMVMGLPARARLSAALSTKLVVMAAEMTYSQAGRWAALGASVSKSTVARHVAACSAEALPGGAFPKGAPVHVQIDEKYIGMGRGKGKSRLYTATVFCGRDLSGGRPRLLRRSVLSSARVSSLAARLDRLLREKYSVGPEDAVWLSGDLAAYIRGFPERLRCCKARYVPDKWHVCKALGDALPELGRMTPGKAMGVLGLLARSGDLTPLQGTEAMAVARLYAEDPGCFGVWGDPSYEGCSQEGMNSHYWAPRFGKLASRFLPSTVEKLSAVIEAVSNGWSLRIGEGRREASWKDPSGVPLSGSPYGDESRMRYVLDTSEMGYRARKMFEGIKFGGV